MVPSHPPVYLRPVDVRGAVARLDGDARTFLGAYALLLPFALAPLAMTSVLPSIDGPFHLAMADLLARAGDAASPYAGLYEPRLWPPPPALPWLALALLGKLFGLASALRVLVALYVAALPLSIAWLARRLGGAATPALLGLPLAYNLGLHHGFLGYVFSLPVLFVTLGWLAALLEERERPARPALWLAVWGVVLYGCHLETFAIGGAAAVAMTLAARSSRRARALALSAWLPAAGLAALWSASTPYLRGAPNRTAWDALSALVATRRAEVAARGFGLEAWDRVRGLHVHLLRGFRDGSDRAASLALLALLAAFALAATRADLRAPSGRPLSRARYAPPLVALAGYLLLPHHFDSYEAMSVAPRVAPLFVAAAIAALPLSPAAFAAEGARLAAVARLAPRALTLGAAALALVYGRVLVGEYRAFGREVADFEVVMARLPRGGRLVGLVFDGDSRVVDVDAVMRGLPSLYVARRGGMVALRYCGMRHFPCRPLARAAEIPAPDPWAPERFDPRRGLAFFDYVLVRGDVAREVVFKGVPVHEIARSGAWVAYGAGAR